MRRTFVHLCLLPLLLVACGGDPSASDEGRTQEALARLVFEALKAGSFDAQAEGVPLAADIEWTLGKVRENAPQEAEKSQERLFKAGGAEAIAEQGLERAKRAFARTYELSSKEFDWSTAEFRGVDLDRTKPEERFGFLSADIWFAVAAGDETYDFLLSKCIKAPQGWLSAGGVHFHPSAPDALMDAKKQMLQAHLRTIGAAMQMYYVIHNDLPETLKVLTEIDEHSGQPFLKTQAVDPWGNELAYERLGGRDFLITSAGPDGAQGTDDDIAWPPKPADEPEDESEGDD